MAGFAELGLNETLVANAVAAGFDTPSPLQRSTIPVLRRGGNAVIRAASGSGVTAGYTLALLDRFAAAGDTRVLIIVPTADRAERVAGTIARLADGTNTRVAALTGGWSAASRAEFVVVAAEKLLSVIEESQIKLDRVEAVVLDGASATIKIAGDETLSKIFASLPREGQRIIVTSDLTEPVRKLGEAHARKALHFPPRPAVEQTGEKAAPAVGLKYIVAPAGRKADQVARYAHGRGGAVTLVCRSRRSAADAERELRVRGFDAHAADYESFERDSAQGPVFAYDAPFAAEQLHARLRAGDVIICERRELAHVKQLAEEAHVRLEASGQPPRETDSLNAFRNELRRAAREEDIEAQLLVLEPLFDELAPEEIAAAACTLLRARRPTRGEAPAKAAMKTWSRLFFSIGERDGVRPADIVGAVTGEAGIRGDEVGKVEIRDTFSVVEVVSEVAERVIKAMNGTTMKNRALRVDYDRKTAVAATRSGRPNPRRAGPRATRGER